MLRWLSLALVLATNVVALPSSQSKEPSNAPSHCQARAWVRAPDMVPGEVIAGDVKIKLSGPCTGAESYKLGLRYKEKVFWKLRWVVLSFLYPPLDITTDGKMRRFRKCPNWHIIGRSRTVICSESDLGRAWGIQTTMKQNGGHTRIRFKIGTCGLCARKNELPLRSRVP